MDESVIEERHGFAGARRAVGGVGGHVGAPHVDKHTTAAVAALAGAIERASADLALAEEPSNFVAALEQAAPGE